MKNIQNNDILLCCLNFDAEVTLKFHLYQIGCSFYKEHDEYKIKSNQIFFIDPYYISNIRYYMLYIFVTRWGTTGIHFN